MYAYMGKTIQIIITAFLEFPGEIYMKYIYEIMGEGEGWGYTLASVVKLVRNLMRGYFG